MKNHHFLIFLSIPSTLSFANNDFFTSKNIISLETIVVSANDDNQINSTKISNNIISDHRDLINLIPSVGYSGGDGRYANKGFSMRGVEGNRVSIAVDGTEIPQYQNSAAYEPYGKINSSRNIIDSELIEEIHINKGSDSFTNSGGLAGNIGMKTKEANSILDGKNHAFFYKKELIGKNDGNKDTVAAALKKNHLDFFMIYSQSKNSQVKNFGKSDSLDESSIRSILMNTGSGRTSLDPMNIKNEALMFKSNVLINKSLTSNLKYIYQERSVDVNNLTFDDDVTAKREGFDRNKIEIKELNFKYKPENSKLVSASDFSFNILDTKILSNTLQSPYKALTSEYGNQFKRSNRLFDENNKNISLKTYFNSFGNINNYYGEHEINLHFIKSKSKVNNSKDDETLIVNCPEKDCFQNTTLQPSLPVDKTQLFTPVDISSLNLLLSDKVEWKNNLKLDYGLKYETHNFNIKNPKLGRLDKFEISDNRISKLSKMVSLSSPINNDLDISIGYSEGMRIPTVSERYAFFSGWGRYIPNPNLKPEQSKTSEIGLNYKNSNSLYSISLYNTRYKDFIELERGKFKPYENAINDSYRNNNIDSAEVTGLDITGNNKLSPIHESLEGFYINYAASYAHGKNNNGTNLLSIQPLNFLLSLNYEKSNIQTSLTTRSFYKKKGNDAKWRKNSIEDEITEFPFLSKSYTVLDFVTSYNISNNIKFRVGVYNLLNKKYTEWDSLRVLKTEGGGLDQVSGNGLIRYTAPQRYSNFALEFKF